VVGKTCADVSPIFQLTNLQSLSVLISEQSKFKNNAFSKNEMKFFQCHTLELLKERGFDNEIWSPVVSSLPNYFPNLRSLRYFFSIFFQTLHILNLKEMPSRVS
jgi:hypothetical protein